MASHRRCTSKTGTGTDPALRQLALKMLSRGTAGAWSSHWEHTESSLGCSAPALEGKADLELRSFSIEDGRAGIKQGL